MNSIRTYYEIDNILYLLDYGKYFNNHGFDVNKFIINKKKKSDFEIRFISVYNEFNCTVLETSDNLRNIKVSVDFENTERKRDFDAYLKNFSKSGLYIISNKLNRLIGYEFDSVENQYIFNLESEFNSGDNFLISIIGGISNYVSINIDDHTTEESDHIVLTGHRTDGLKQMFHNEKVGRKSYGDVKSLSDDLSEDDFLHIEDTINIDYSKFENHIFFGSAYSKFINAIKKIDKVKDLKEWKDSASNSSKQMQKIKDLILNILDEFTPYEKYLYEKSKKYNEVEYQEWVDNTVKESEDYDSRNNNFLLYAVPPSFIENDESNLFTNFILLIGEFMDSSWTVIRSLQNIYNFDIHSKEMISDKFIDTMLLDLGFDVDYKYTDSDFKDFFGSDLNLKKVSNEISRRLLYSLPFMTKIKGTNKSIEYILNTFGIPPELLSIYEFGIVSRKNDLKRSLRENDWYVRVGSNDSFELNYGSTNLDQDNYTFELGIRRLVGSGKLIEFNGSNYVAYNVNNDDEYRIQIIQGGNTIYTSPYFKNNNLWDFLVVRRDETNGKFLKYTLHNSYENTIDRFEEDYTYASSGMNFTDISIFDGDGGDITEFKLFNSSLSKEVIDHHSLDIRSVAEDNANTLQFRFKFYRPDDDPVEIKSTDNKSYTLTSEIDRNNFDKDTFSTTSILQTSLSSLHSTSKLEFFNRSLKYELSSKRKATEIDDVEYVLDLPFLGIFISPSDMYDKNFIRKTGYNRDFVLDNNSKFDYTFENLLEKRELKNRVEYDFYQDSTLFNILDILNIKVYNVLKEFVPESTNLLTGLLIKNNILERNKELKRRSRVTHRHLPVNKYKADFVNKQVRANKIKGEIHVHPHIKSDPKIQLESIIKTAYDGSRSTVQKPIETFNMFKRSPWLRRSIIGNNRNSKMLTAEEIEELFNSGARILVK